VRTARSGDGLARIKPTTPFCSAGLTHLTNNSVLEFGFRELFGVLTLAFGVSV